MVRIMSYENLEKILSLLPNDAEVTVSLGSKYSAFSGISDDTQKKLTELMQEYINFGHEILVEGTKRMMHNGNTVLYREQSVSGEPAGILVLGYEDSSRYRTNKGLSAVKIKRIMDRDDKSEIDECFGGWHVFFDQPESIEPRWTVVKTSYRMKNSDILQLLKDMDEHKAGIELEEAKWDLINNTQVILTPDKVEVKHSGSYSGVQLPEKIKELLSEIIPYSWSNIEMTVK